MKTKLTILALALIALSCKEQSEVKTEDAAVAVSEEIAQVPQADYATYGEVITDQNLMAIASVKEQYKNLKSGDSVTVKFKAPIEAVCKSMGCWMRLDIGAEEQVYVKFKDYGFFVPTDSDGEAIVEGKAFVEETSVDEQQHLAEDGGASSEEIAAITEPKREMKLMANGVLMKK
ncbi:DUF4920 domain-containing protein [Dokdonia ponticola]|uniref:DUF4920 domain-containing protein n=1 Tax=Dokdonia ponticola TaxID=2041041 RepID=A0ABV9I1C4_9FLAO